MDRVERSTRQSLRNKRERNEPHTQAKKAKSVEKPRNEAKSAEDIKNMPNGAKNYAKYLVHTRTTRTVVTYAEYLYKKENGKKAQIKRPKKIDENNRQRENADEPMEEEIEITGGTDLHNGFRKNVLDVMRKQFDKDEYKRLKRMVRDGKDVYDHPDLMEKIRESQGDYPKCLKILRGFVFWLQNVQQEGAFMPWQDLECIALVQASR